MGSISFVSQPGSNACHRVFGNRVIGGKRVFVEHLAVRAADRQFAPIH